MVDVADCADVDVGLLSLELASGGAYGEAVARGGRGWRGGGGGSEVEDCGGVEERRGEEGFGFREERDGNRRRGRGGRGGGIGVGVGEFCGSC